LPDATEFSVAISITDVAGNTGTPDTFTVETDFAPILTIDEVGEGGAVDLSDTADASITGTTLGVEEDQQVTVTVTGTASGLVLTDTALVGADGTWTLPIAPEFFGDLEPGETFTVNATVDNAAGRTANAEQAGIDAYLSGSQFVVDSTRAGSDIAFEIFTEMSVATGNVLNAVEFTASFDPSLGSISLTGFDIPTALSSSIIQPNTFNITELGGLGNLNDGTFTFAGGSLAGFDNLDDSPLIGFGLTDFDENTVAAIRISDGAGQNLIQSADILTVDADSRPTLFDEFFGDSVSFFGTSGDDTITAENVDTLIRGRGGDDTIDVTATGTNIVVFELDQASNGTDTVTGFTTGDTFQSDVIAFLGEADLRGDGDFVETLAAGEALGVNTGFAIFTTALSDTNAATLDAAFEGLTGENMGDVVYFLAGDGTDAALARATVNGTDDASVEILANFSAIGDLGQLNADNVILPDPVTGGV